MGWLGPRHFVGWREALPLPGRLAFPERIGRIGIHLARKTKLGLLSGQTPRSEGPVKVSDLIGSRKEVFSITEDTSVHQAAQYLREKQVRSVGVMNASGKLTGVISQSDVSDKVAAENRCPAWMKTSDIMTRELVTVTPEMTVEDRSEERRVGNK